MTARKGWIFDDPPAVGVWRVAYACLGQGGGEQSLPQRRPVPYRAVPLRRRDMSDSFQGSDPMTEARRARALLAR